MSAKKYASLAAWLDDATVRRNHGVGDTTAGVLTVVELRGPHDTASRQAKSVRPRPRVTVGYKPGATVLWTASWEIPPEVDLSGYGMA
jgi:hypothetical protein